MNRGPNPTTGYRPPYPMQRTPDFRYPPNVRPQIPQSATNLYEPGPGMSNYAKYMQQQTQNAQQQVQNTANRYAADAQQYARQQAENAKQQGLYAAQNYAANAAAPYIEAANGYMNNVGNAAKDIENFLVQERESFKNEIGPMAFSIQRNMIACAILAILILVLFSLNIIGKPGLFLGLLITTIAGTLIYFIGNAKIATFMFKKNIEITEKFAKFI